MTNVPVLMACWSDGIKDGILLMTSPYSSSVIIKPKKHLMRSST